jgi:hypothetical protein
MSLHCVFLFGFSVFRLPAHHDIMIRHGGLQIAPSYFPYIHITLSLSYFCMALSGFEPVLLCFFIVNGGFGWVDGSIRRALFFYCCT